MGFLNAFRKLDMFTKVEANHENRTTHGGIMSIVVGALIFIVCFFEISEQYKYRESHEFVVDSSLDHMLAINFDVTVNAKCSVLRMDHVDRSASFNRIKSTIKKEDSYFDIEKAQSGINYRLSTQHKNEDHIHDIIRLSSRKLKPKKFSNKFKNAPKTACRFYGSVVVNKIKGSLHITNQGHGFFGIIASGETNFTHVIDELSFGTFYPSLVNPLDNTYQVSSKGMASYRYSISVVPTIYKGIDGTELSTNQYAVHQQSVPVESPFDHPGIFINYDIEPIMVKVSEVRLPFTKFLVKLCSIIGGIFVTTGILLNLVDFTPFKSKQFRGQRKDSINILN